MRIQHFSTAINSLSGWDVSDAGKFSLVDSEILDGSDQM